MPHEMQTIGLIEDDLVMGESLIQRLQLEGYKTTWWQTGQEACANMQQVNPDIVVCDLRLPDISGDEVFRKVKSEFGGPPFLFITAYGEIDQAVELMRAGAGDYVTKPFEVSDFLQRIDVLLTQRAITSSDNSVLGTSSAMQEIAVLLHRVANIDSTLLFTGETGVGKEVATRFMHQISATADRPFMAVNCAAIPAELIESELFGHEKGAFTGAKDTHLGYAERAQGGILFLDEIGELPLTAQTRLLRLLQERVFTRVGGEKELPFSARIVCATNADLEQMIEEKLFRRDLFYRINVIPVHVPPLRQRHADILPLINYYVELFAETMPSNVTGLSSLAEESALSYEWPGNVRELRNRVERAVALAHDVRLGQSDLFPELAGGGNSDERQTIATLADVRDFAERRQILRALEKTGGQTGKAAALLGVSRTTMWEKMRRLDLLADDLS